MTPTKNRLRPIASFIGSQVKHEARVYGQDLAHRALRQAGVVVFFGGMFAFGYNRLRNHLTPKEKK